MPRSPDVPSAHADKIVVRREVPIPYDWQPTLTGRLVILRPLRPEDQADLYTVASDPLIWEQHPDKTRHTAAGFDAFFRKSLASGGALLVHDAQTGRVIGSSRYFGCSEERSEVEIGWTFLARSHWGGRYNGEMKQLMLQHAFQFVERVVFLIGVDNRRSQRAVEKLGAVHVGSRPNDTGQESLCYEITATSFARRAGEPG